MFRADGLLVPGIIGPGTIVSRTAKDADGFYRVDGNGPPRRLSSDSISDFKFAPSGLRIAWVTPPTGSSTVGDLCTADGEHHQEDRLAGRAVRVRSRRNAGAGGGLSGIGAGRHAGLLAGGREGGRTRARRSWLHDLPKGRWVMYSRRCLDEQLVHAGARGLPHRRAGRREAATHRHRRLRLRADRRRDASPTRRGAARLDTRARCSSRISRARHHL